MKRITEEYAYYLYNNLKDKLVFYAHYGYYYKNSDQKHVWLLKNSKIENRHIGNREMVCTLMSNLLPQRKPEELIKEGLSNKKSRKESLTNVCVFDIQNSQWRSFRLDSVISFKKIK